MKRFFLCFFLVWGGFGVRADLLISEFLADNRTSLLDEDAERPDWVEIYNAGNEVVSLGGYFLTDDPTRLNRWAFPATNVAAKGFLVLFASGKDRGVAGKPLHANFSLSAGGEYLALVKPDGVEIEFEYAPEFPRQDADVSYGLAGMDGGSWMFFGVPSPGVTNSANPLQVAAGVVFDPPSVVSTNTSATELRTSEVGGVIRYTVNGTEPTATSSIYSSILRFTSSTVVRSRVFVVGKAPGPIRTETFTVLDSTGAAFSSNLPVMVLSTFGVAPNETTARRVSFLLTEPSRETGRTILGGRAAVEGRGTIKYRGSSSLGFPKHSLAFEAIDERGDGRDVSFLGMPEDPDWVLYAPYTEKTMIRDVLAYELFGKMGHYSVRTRYVEVFLDTTGGKLIRSDYAGVYVLMEKVKRGKNRVNIEELHPSQNNQPEVSGGYIFKKDRLDPADVGFTTSRTQLAYVEPKEQIITAGQKAYVKSFFAGFETALYGTQFANPTNGWAPHIDVRSFIDTHLLVEGAKNIDGYRLSSYMFKDRGGRLQMGPAWDYNLTFGNANYANGWLTNGWYNAGMDEASYPWYGRLFQDANFKQLWVDRWAELRAGPWSTAAVLRSVDEKAAYLAEAQVRNFQKWPILGQYVWPNWYIGKTYADEVNWMKQWITGRLKWMDGESQVAPVFRLASGEVPSSWTLTLTGGSSVVYYTRDGSDPRTSGGGISSKASSYNAPVVMTGNARIVARSRLSTTAWSAPVEAIYVAKWPTLLVTEIMYHPLSGGAEFIEVLNTGTQALSLAGFKLRGGVEFDFGAGSIPVLQGGERAIVVNDVVSFLKAYGQTNRVAGEFSGALSNGENRVKLEGPLGEPILDFRYGDARYAATDGLGFSLVFRDEQAPRDTWDEMTAWRASGNVGGNPGVKDFPSQIPTVFVNEVLARGVAPEGDFIELRNPNAWPVDVGNWWVTDDRQEPNKYRIPNGTIISAGGYLVLRDQDFEPKGPNQSGFRLDGNGDGVYLFSADGVGRLTGFSDGFEFGASESNVSFGRFKLGDGNDTISSQWPLSVGQPNYGPKVGPVVIAEVYAPTSLAEEAFVELKNLRQQEFRFTSMISEGRWRLKGIDFEFPTNAVIAPEGLMLLVRTNPVGFRARFQVPATVPILGPFLGELDPDGEGLELQQPKADLKEIGGIETVYVTMDRVEYGKGAGWVSVGPTAAWSGERIYLGAFGDDAANWRIPVGGPSPGVGTKGSPNLAPRIAIVSPVEAVVGVPLRLVGKVADDGLPVGGGRSLRWEVVNGSSEVSIENTGNADSRARFWAEGSFTIRAHGGDGVLESSSELVVNVRPNVEYQKAVAMVFTVEELKDRQRTGPGGDYDGDGAMNIDEFLAETNLREASSRLVLNSRLHNQNFVELQFEGVLNRWYGIQRRKPEANGSWETIVHQIGSGTNSVTFPLTDEVWYYRLFMIP